MIVIFFAAVGYASESNWSIRFGLYSADSVFTDNWNRAGVREGAIDEWDIYDTQKFFPPTSEYAVLFFPHADPSEPDYWPWPNNNDYAIDLRSPLDSVKTWELRILTIYGSTRTLTIWWNDMDNIPGDYLPLLISPDNDSINLYIDSDFTRTFPPGVQRWKLSIKPGYYESISVLPEGHVIRVSETRHYRAYLHHDSDSVECHSASWEYHGSGGVIDGDGYLEGISPGGGFVVADIGSQRDSAEVTIIPGGDFFDISLYLGWNLISLPAIPISNRKEDIFPGMDYFVYFYDPIAGDFSIVDNLDVGTGYFVLALCDETFTFAGDSLDTVDVELFRGWNLLGGPGETVYFSDFITTPPGIILCIPYAFDECYFTADSLLLTEGFWVLSGTSGNLIITQH